MSTQLLDLMEPLTTRSVQNVFAEMLGIPVTAEAAGLEDPALTQIIGSVGFVGRANAVIHLGTSLSFATLITAKMLGLPESEVTDEAMINDALGELSNVVVGTVKSNLCDQGWPCTLSVPSIVRGRELAVGDTRDALRRVLKFCAGEHRLLVELVVHASAPNR